MKTIKHVSLIATLVTASLFAQAKIEVGTYQIDPMHSKVGFEVPHLVISTVEGSFQNFEGSLVIDKDFSKSNLDAVVKIDSINTGVEKRDTHLKSADFFDSAKYPQMTFKSTGIKGKADAFKLSGDLTIRGIKKKVTFDAKYLGAVTDGYGNRKAAFQATTKIKRQDFGLKWNAAVEVGPVVGDEVTIELKIQATRSVESKQAGN